LLVQARAAIVGDQELVPDTRHAVAMFSASLYCTLPLAPLTGTTKPVAAAASSRLLSAPDRDVIPERVDARPVPNA
jgi:hypothetical protein